MTITDKVSGLYRKANETFGRHGIIWSIIFLVIPSVSLGALAGYLATTADWYWQHFGWLGVFFAIMLTWVLFGLGLLILRALFNPSWLRTALVADAVPLDDGAHLCDGVTKSLAGTVRYLEHDPLSWKHIRRLRSSLHIRLV